MKMLKKEGEISDAVIENMLSRRHTGFHVHIGGRIRPEGETALGNLAKYIVRACFSRERTLCIPTEKSPDGAAKVVCHSKDGRTEQTFDAIDRLARLVVHIPDKYEQIVRYVGRSVVPIASIECESYRSSRVRPDRQKDPGAPRSMGCPKPRPSLQKRFPYPKNSFQSIDNLCPFPFRFDDHPSAGGRGTIEKPVVFSLTKNEFLSYGEQPLEVEADAVDQLFENRPAVAAGQGRLLQETKPSRRLRLARLRLSKAGGWRGGRVRNSPARSIMLPSKERERPKNWLSLSPTIFSWISGLVRNTCSWRSWPWSSCGNSCPWIEVCGSGRTALRKVIGSIAVYRWPALKN